MSDPEFFEGETGWQERGAAQTRPASFVLRRGKSLAFEFVWERSRYEGILPAVGELAFKGQFQASGDGGSREGSAACKLTPIDDGFELVGTWSERNVGQRSEQYPVWWALLSRVEE